MGQGSEMAAELEPGRAPAGQRIAVSGTAPQRIRASRLLLIAVSVAGVAGLVWLFAPSPTGLRWLVRSHGGQGWLVYLGLYSLLVLGPVPRVALNVTAGALFGVFLGAALAVTGSLTGACGAYLIGRGVRGAAGEGRPLAARTPRWLRGNAFAPILLARLSPFIPFFMVSYGSGVARVALGRYATATVLGVLPGTLLAALLGSTGLRSDVRPALPYAVVLGLVAAVWGAQRTLRRRRGRRELGVEAAR